MQLGISSRATRDFTWLASLRNYDSNEKTPQWRVVQPRPARRCVDTTPLTIKTLTGKVEGTYRLPQNIALTGGLDLVKQERDVPVGDPNPAGFDNQRYVPWRTQVDETTLRLEARRSLAETLNGRVVYAHSKRDGSRIHAYQRAAVRPDQPDLHRRPRRATSSSWCSTGRRRRRSRSTSTSSSRRTTTAPATSGRTACATAARRCFRSTPRYTISENWQLTAFYTHDQAKANQSGQRNANGGAGEAVKDANLEDTGDTFGFGVRGSRNAEVKIGADLLYQRNVNKYPETVTLTGPGTPYPSSGGVTRSARSPTSPIP